MSKIKAMITEEQLNTLKKQQSSLNEGFRLLGSLDVQKQVIHSQINEVYRQVEETKKELEEEYGNVSIDLKDGSYTEIEEDK